MLVRKAKLTTSPATTRMPGLFTLRVSSPREMRTPRFETKSAEMARVLKKRARQSQTSSRMSSLMTIAPVGGPVLRDLQVVLSALQHPPASGRQACFFSFSSSVSAGVGAAAARLRAPRMDCSGLAAFRAAEGLARRCGSRDEACRPCPWGGDLQAFRRSCDCGTAPPDDAATETATW